MALELGEGRDVLVLLVPQMQTAAPAWAMASAMPRPMPLLPPVTSATLPVRSNPGYAMRALSFGESAQPVRSRPAARI